MGFIEFIIGFIVIMVATFGGFILLAIGAVTTALFLYEYIRDEMDKRIDSETSEE